MVTSGLNPETIDKYRQVSIIGDGFGRCCFRWIVSHLLLQDVAMDTQEVTEEQHAVHAVVHAFLTQVCCSFKHGINFYDRSFGTSNK